MAEPAVVGARMRVLAHIHTFNDADVIDATIEAIRLQTRPVDEILVVDNASSDGTLQRPALKHATVLRHAKNSGTSGAVHSGFSFALEHGYDWIWIFDADSVPEPGALAQLLDTYGEFPPPLQDETAFLACLGSNVGDDTPTYTGIFTRHRIMRLRPAAEERYYRCHVTFWSGSLYRLAAVRQIGLPNADYFADWGEVEYGYRVMKAGYQGFACTHALYHHNVRGYTSLKTVDVGAGAAATKRLEVPPLRCYYNSRNALYLSLYDSADLGPWMVVYVVLKLMGMMVNLMRLPGRHGAQLTACFRGIWHGITGNMTARY